ncbi:MAG: Trm112 family protein [Planctomycetota bacterium]
MPEAERISETLLDVLQCPLGKAKLKQIDDRLVCPCGLGFPIEDGIPVMLLDEAQLPNNATSLADVRCTYKAS